MLDIRYGAMMSGPPMAHMPHGGPPSSYGGGPQRGGYHGGMGRDRPNGPPRFNDRGYQNDSGSIVLKNLHSIFRYIMLSLLVNLVLLLHVMT